MQVRRTVNAAADARTVFDYLVDFENATEWDSGTVSCDRLTGDGGPGTTYRNMSRFAGRTVALTYTTETVDFPVLVIVGRTGSTTSHDTITVRERGQGCEVEYVADFSFTGPLRLVAPLMAPLLVRLGNRTEEQLRAALARL